MGEKAKKELQYIDGVDAMIFACADHAIECSFCGSLYKEHEDYGSFFEGAFGEGGKIACCRKCFENEAYEE